MNITQQSKTVQSSSVATVNYPKTGKRGVPQQFPRRLYEMLQSETKLLDASPDHPKVIFWSDSGKAFRIADVAEFSTTVLPKYFRTKKFSSFQRNLNLYGFSKVRRGRDSDMYAHPSFVRDQAETLYHLRKLSTTSSRRGASDKTKAAKLTAARSVSPSPTRMLATEFHAPLPRLASTSSNKGQQTPTWVPPVHKVPLSPERSKVVEQSIPRRTASKGALNLLAFAMEQCELAAAVQQ